MGGLLLVLAYFVGLFLHQINLATTLFAQTVLWCAVPYLAASHLLYRSIHMPAAEQRTLLLINTLLPYLLLVLVLALLQQRYSRGAVLMVASLTTYWFWISERVIQRQNKLQLLCLNDQTKAELLKELGDQAESLDAHLELLEWTDHLQPMPSCDGLLVNCTDELTETQQLQLAQIKQRHIRLYSVAAIGESITGRKSPQELSNPLWQPDGNPAYDRGSFNLSKHLVQQKLGLRRTASLGIAPQLRRIARRPQVHDVTIVQSDAQAVGAVDMLRCAAAELNKRLQGQCVFAQARDQRLALVRGQVLNAVGLGVARRQLAGQCR